MRKLTVTEKAVIDGLKAGLHLHQLPHGRYWGLFPANGSYNRGAAVCTIRSDVLVRLQEDKLLIVRCHEGEMTTRLGLSDEVLNSDKGK